MSIDSSRIDICVDVVERTAGLVHGVIFVGLARPDKIVAAGQPYDMNVDLGRKASIYAALLPSASQSSNSRILGRLRVGGRRAFVAQSQFVQRDCDTNVAVLPAMDKNVLRRPAR